jgi:hypothetical protein
VVFQKDGSPLVFGEESSSWAAEFSTRRDSGHITTSDLLWFALQMARAMSFLTDNMVSINISYLFVFVL